MEYTSTRDNSRRVSSARAILTGLAPDGGLFVPASLPKLDIEALQGKSYTQVAFEVLRLFLTDYDEGFLKQALEDSYGQNFGGRAGALARLADGLYSLELWHGPTAAFKDYALQLMPKLLVEARRMLGETDETLILVATSGDTGSAALAGYAGLPGIKIAVFYPQDGTSPLQRLQMTTCAGDNLQVFGVRGNFDDAQRGVKAAFVDAALAEKLAARGQKLSSANSINWGRLVPQVVYYVYAYLCACAGGGLRYGQPLDFCVPTGNFGDIMAGWYAKQLGLPVGRLVCASNKNNVLADFFATGTYDARRDFHKTSSPSMDILVSSNLERLLWHASSIRHATGIQHASGSDAKVRQWMASLAAEGRYTVDEAVRQEIGAVFAGGWADEPAVFAEIKRVYDKYACLCDPHTAVGFRVWAEHTQGDGNDAPAVVLSTASPYKFCADVLRALGQPAPEDPFQAVAALEGYSGTQAPESLKSLAVKAERFTDIIDAEKIITVPLEM